MFTGVCWYWTLCNLSMVYDYFKPQIAACCQNNTIYFTFACFLHLTNSFRTRRFTCCHCRWPQVSSNHSFLFSVEAVPQCLILLFIFRTLQNPNNENDATRNQTGQFKSLACLCVCDYTQRINVSWIVWMTVVRLLFPGAPCADPGWTSGTQTLPRVYQSFNGGGVGG